MQAGNDEAAFEVCREDDFFSVCAEMKDDETHYFGKVNESGLPRGMGVAYYPYRQVYYGEWIDGKREGEGQYLTDWKYSYDSETNIKSSGTTTFTHDANYIDGFLYGTIIFSWGRSNGDDIHSATYEARGLYEAINGVECTAHEYCRSRISISTEVRYPFIIE